MSFTLPFLIHIRYSIVIFKWFYPKPISLLLFISFDLILCFKLHPYLMTIRYPNLKSVCEELRFLSVKKKNAIEEQRFRSFASVTLCFNWFWVNKKNQPWLSQSALRKFPLHWAIPCVHGFYYKCEGLASDAPGIMAQMKGNRQTVHSGSNFSFMIPTTHDPRDKPSKWLPEQMQGHLGVPMWLVNAGPLPVTHSTTCSNQSSSSWFLSSHFTFQL